MRTLKAEVSQGCTCPLFEAFLAEPIGFTFLCRTQLSLR
jgi:hypothetical protein